MRTLLLLRGSAGCGKSTWIEQNDLKPYTLCADDIRLLCSSPRLNAYGYEEITQTCDNEVWKILFELLEERMKNGEFTVIDATNSKTSEMNRYKKLAAAYKYRIYCVDFTDIPIDIVKERNRNRLPEAKRVPDWVIDKMYSRFQTQKIPSGIAVIKPDELDTIWMKPIDMSKYKCIHHIGDIHGCYTVLQEYFDQNGGIKDDEFYIFVGDYIDRGIENAEVTKFLLSIYNKPNVLLLEGNHEKTLWLWANGERVHSKEFELSTKQQLQFANIAQKDARRLYRKLGQCAYYTYGENTYLVTHGGLSTLPENLTKVATIQMIKGAGAYGQALAVAESFTHNTASNCYQIHGHRNLECAPIHPYIKVFNLEDKVEYGGNLRCVQIFADGTYKCVEIQNTVFKELDDARADIDEDSSVADAIVSMRRNKYIQEKCFGSISSFNFTRQVFTDGLWNSQSIRARGLYINTKEPRIVARAYEKFFNINELPETSLETLPQKFEFPLQVYVKENGFLGIVSYNDEDDSLFIATKSNPTSQHAGWLRDMLYKKLSNEQIEQLKAFAKDNNVSFVFECVDMTNDPHIIEYPHDELFLLDIVYNKLQFRKMPYKDMEQVADELGLIPKTFAGTINTWSEFYEWYRNVLKEDYTYKGRIIEGFVVEDSDGFMVKLKLTYYHFWRFMRSIACEAIKKGYVDPRRTSALTSPLANQFYGWVRTLHDVDNLGIMPEDICTLRRMFYATEAGKAFI